MQIKSWIQSRQTPGTLADVARRALENDRSYRDVERTLQSMYVLEALIRHDGDQQKAAEAIGVHRMTVNRVIRGMNLTAVDIRKVVRRMQGDSDAARN